MGLEKEFWVFQQNRNILATRPEQSDKSLLLTSGSNPVHFNTALKTANRQESMALPRDRSPGTSSLQQERGEQEERAA